MNQLFIFFAISSISFATPINIHAQTPKSKPSSNESYCINTNDSSDPDYQYISSPQCFKDRTFGEINAHKPREKIETDIVSCEQIVYLAHQVYMDSKKIPVTQFDEKYVQVMKDQAKDPLRRSHSFYSTDSSNNLTKEEHALIDLIALDVSQDITSYIKQEIKKSGIDQVKKKLTTTYGITASILVGIDSPEELLAEFSIDKIKSILIKDKVTTAKKSTTINANMIHNIMSSISNKKRWITSSLQLIKDSNPSNYAVFKWILKNIKVRYSPAFLANLIAENAIEIFTAAETFHWIEDAENENSFINQPQFFSAFAANSNFTVGQNSCKDLYLKFCSYYYGFACKKGTGYRSRVRNSFLEAFITQLSKNLHRQNFQDEADKARNEQKYIVPQDSIRIIVPLRDPFPPRAKMR